MERPDLVLRVGSHPHPLERPCEAGRTDAGAPAIVARERGPAVVVLRAPDRDDAAVVRRAAADHTGALKRDRLAPDERPAVVAPLVRGDERAAVEQIGRPEPRCPRTVVRPRLDENDPRVALGREPAGNDAATAAAADDEDVTCEAGGHRRGYRESDPY